MITILPDVLNIVHPLIEKEYSYYIYCNKLVKVAFGCFAASQNLHKG